jgi:hypothetical protein
MASETSHAGCPRALESREAVETVKMTDIRYVRPSMPAVCWRPLTSAAAAQVSVLGALAAETITGKINYIGEGSAAVSRVHQVNQLFGGAFQSVKVTDARGIPPRGWPV